MATYSCPSLVQGCALRLTRLNECGVPLDPLSGNSRIQTRKFVSVVSTPQNEDPKEIMLQNACSEIDTYFRTQRRTKFYELKMTLSRVELPVLEMLLDASLLEAPDTPGEFIGWATANGLTQPNPNPKMLEVQGRNANQNECGLGGAGSAAVGRHLWASTTNWAISDAFNITNTDPFTIVLAGDAMNNPNWFPSFPGPTFPSWSPGGGSPSANNLPTGPAPAVLPSGVDADPWSLDHQATIQAGGPYAFITEGEFFDTTTWECNFVGFGS